MPKIYGFQSIEKGPPLFGCGAMSQTHYQLLMSVGCRRWQNWDALRHPMQGARPRSLHRPERSPDVGADRPDSTETAPPLPNSTIVKEIVCVRGDDAGLWI